MSDLIKRIDEALESSVKKNYEDLLTRAEERANSGGMNLDYNSTGHITAEKWINIADYAVCLRNAKLMAKEYPFLEWDEERGKRITNTAKVNIIAKITESIPRYEETGATFNLGCCKNIIKFLQEESI